MTPLQDLLIFDSETYGRILVLDGAIQVSERDEVRRDSQLAVCGSTSPVFAVAALALRPQFSYQEMIVNVPLFAHPNPKSVFIVGGGDGGALREAARHPCVERVRATAASHKHLAFPVTCTSLWCCAWLPR